MSIHRSFTIGNDGEAFVTDLFQRAEIECSKHTDKDTRHEHDLTCKLAKLDFTCEVKFDVMAQKTMNLAIEIHNSKKDKPSGLEATKADLWAHIILDGEHKVGYLTSVSKLREFCKTVEPLKRITAGGDKNANLLIYPCDVILPAVFHRIEMLSKDDLQKLVKRLVKE